MSVRLSEKSSVPAGDRHPVAQWVATYSLRWLTWGTAAVLLCTVMVVGGFRSAGVDMTTVGQATPAVVTPVVQPVAVTVNLSGGGETSAPVAPPVGAQPTEDDPAFNPCTMGVNNDYPETDARHFRPGPCDMSTVLPNGARFEVSTLADGSACQGRGAVYGQYGALVVVRAVSAPAFLVPVASEMRAVCVPREGAPLDGVQGLVQELMYQVAAELDK